MSKRHPSILGFTYLMLLWWVAIGGVMLAALGHRWAQEAQRQKEMELQHRATEIQQALLSYYTAGAQAGVAASAADGTAASRWPQRLNDLLDDKRSVVVLRHLRQVWRDPMTGQSNWGLVKDPTTGGITGVYSLSTLTPLRAPDGIKSFKAWRFVAMGAAHGS